MPIGCFAIQLAMSYPSINVDPDRIYMRDGHIYTSAGITAGIDLSLALIEEDLGREAARFVAGLMVTFPRGPGGQNQFSAFLQIQAKTSRPDFRDFQAWIVANPGEALDVDSLAERVGMSSGNFTRLFQTETGMTPAKFVEHPRRSGALQAGADRTANGGDRRSYRLWLTRANAALIPAVLGRHTERLSCAISFC